ncbi:unnamed protein product [Hydatigera taeniaeformis]|uniref:YL1_C domain-containing protein n=1 Tax=Hydatigena taeniaeformis TaxID=6205 RepID=A0A0R3WX71_HYDTA|nr:unnamed protein product [Hydatigera taeniaeformis]
MSHISSLHLLLQKVRMCGSVQTSVTVIDDAFSCCREVEMRRMLVERDARCARTLVSFADEASFVAAFPSYAANTTLGKRSGLTSSQSRKRPMRHCPLTGRIARYLDPLTRTPYADLAAFRALRHLYRLHLETGASPVDLLRRFRNGEIKLGTDGD